MVALRAGKDQAAFSKASSALRTSTAMVSFGPFERAGGIQRIKACLGNLLQRGAADAQRHYVLRQPLFQLLQPDLRNCADVLFIERMEHHDFIDTVDKIGPEMASDFVHHCELRQCRGAFFHRHRP